jgi:hypothetical protein
VLLAAEASLAKDDPASVIRTVTPLEAANAGRADVHHILERAYARARDRVNTLREADAWLAIDPSGNSDLSLQADIGELATQPASSDAAIVFLASRMGTPGVDILYDLAYGPGQSAAVSKRAHTALAQPEVRSHAGPAAAILLDFRAATNCEAKKGLLARVKTDGDSRAVPLLQPLTSRRGMGACMRGDGGALDAVIAAVSKRTRML